MFENKTMPMDNKVTKLDVYHHHPCPAPHAPMMEVDDAVLAAFRDKIRPDPLTGEIELSDLIQYFTMNPDDPYVKKLTESTSSTAERRAEEKRIAASFDLSTLRMHRRAIWLISLEYSGLNTEKTVGASPEQVEKLSKEDPKHTFQLYCYIKAGPGTDPTGDDNFRCMDEYIGLPTSKQVEDFIRLSMAKPITIFSPNIPSTLLFSYNLTQHKQALEPFLQSFPSPFRWKFEPAALSQRISEKSYTEKQVRFEKYMKIFEEIKGAGNAAYARNDREAAIENYKEANAHLEKMLFKGAVDAEEREKMVNGMKAVCYSNSAAARLIPGDGMDAEGAVADAELALKADQDYAKAYIRLPRAHVALGDHDQAQEAIARALRRPQLENHLGLVDHLISLKTSGRGLPQELESFQIWLQKESVKRMEGVGGEWRRRCDEQRKKLGVPDNV